MKSLFVLLCAFFCVLASAADPQPIDFLTNALKTNNVKFTEPKIVTSYNPFIYASKILVYLDKVKSLVDKEHSVWDFYRFQYRNHEGKLQDCTAGIGYKKGFKEFTRIVSISDCNANPFTAQTTDPGYIESTISLEPAAGKPTTPPPPPATRQ